MKNKLSITCIIIAISALLVAVPIQTASADSSKLDIVNLSGAYITLSYDQLLTMPKTTVNADLYCYGALVTAGDWAGVQVSYLLALANATSEVGSITLTASDGYRASIPIAVALDPLTIIAYQKDGQPLNEGLRLVLPGMNGAAWIAMIITITMSTNGALSPEGLSVSVPNSGSLASSQGNIPQGQQQTPTPTPTAPTPTATLTPTPQSTNPANGAHQNQPAPTADTPHNEAANSQTLTVLVVALAAVLCITTVISASYLQKRKNKV
jgi:hypothetical protein